MSARRFVLLALASLLAAATMALLRAPFSLQLGWQRLRLTRALGPPHDVSAPRGPVRVWSGGRADAPTVVLIHGFTDHAGSWNEAAASLASELRVVVPELAGHGGSAPSEAPLTYDDVFAGLTRALEAHGGAAPMVLVGNSLGGWLALRYAREHPDRVARVVAVNSAGLRQEIPRERLIPTTRAGVEDKLRAALGEHAPALPGFVLDDIASRSRDPRLASFLDTLEEDDLLEGTLGTLAPRVDLVWGTPDPWFPEGSYLPRLAAELPAPTQTLLEGCGHSPQLGCLPRVLERIRDAVAKRHERGAPAAAR
ncbi:MAG: alpha/beta fold hydrolase [Myxococcales bacterium]